MTFHGYILKRLRNMWRETINNTGGICPVCDRWGKTYPRSINKTMAQSLIWLCSKPGWVDIPATAPRDVIKSNQLPTLRWWGLVERLPSNTGAKKHSGVWRATHRGRSFVAGYLAIEKTVVTYKGEVIARSDERIHISQIHSEFNYSEVMEKANV